MNERSFAIYFIVPLLSLAILMTFLSVYVLHEAYKIENKKVVTKQIK